MNKPEFDRAVAAAEEFLARASKVRWTEHQCYPPSTSTYWTCAGPTETGALRRQSMELTRALAEMRKP